MSNLDQLQQLAALSQSFQNQLDIQPMIDAIASSMANQSGQALAAAVTEIKDAGLNPDYYIPMSRTAIRAQQMRSRIEHEQRMQDLEYRKVQAEVVAAEASAQRLAAHRPVPAPPQPASV